MNISKKTSVETYLLKEPAWMQPLKRFIGTNKAIVKTAPFVVAAEKSSEIASGRLIIHTNKAGHISGFSMERIKSENELIAELRAAVVIPEAEKREDAASENVKFAACFLLLAIVVFELYTP